MRRPADLAAAVVRRARGALARPIAAPAAGSVGRRPTRPDALARSEERLAALGAVEADLVRDPTSHARAFRQPDGVSCGAACLVYARMIHDPLYAMWIVTGFDPVTGRDHAGELHGRWAAAVRTMHRRVTGVHDHDGRLQPPWPRLLGTPPWAAARQMGGGPDASGLPGAQYRARIIDPEHLDAEFDAIAVAVCAGHTVPLYVGDGLRPAHATLVVGAADDRLRVYEPSAGRLARVARSAFEHGTFTLDGWSVPWFTVLPR